MNILPMEQNSKRPTRSRERSSKASG